MKVRHFTFALKSDGDPHECVVVNTKGRDRRIEVTESPTGRSVQIWVDGKRVYPQATDRQGSEG